MTAGRILVVIAAILVAILCVRLGFWQLSRWHEKQGLNAARDSALAAPPVEITSAASPQYRPGGRLTARGRYDERHQVLLAGRMHEGSPGVEVVTPLVLAGDTTAILVNRGWVDAADGATARPGDYPEPGDHEVTGIAGEPKRGAGGPPLEQQDQYGATVWIARAVDLDTLAPRLPYRLVPALILQLPGPGVPPAPLRSRPERFNESMHLGYAIQWFSIAAIVLGGTGVLSRGWARAKPA